MEITNILILGWAAFIIGLFLFFGAFARKGIFKGSSQPIVAAIGVIAVVLGIVWAVMPTIQEYTDLGAQTIIIDTTGDTTAQYASWEITPSETMADVTLNSAKTGFTVPAHANQTNHTLNTAANTTDLSGIVEFHFHCVPQPYASATQDDLATIYYEVLDAEINVDTSSDSYKLITKSGGNRQAYWNSGSNASVDYVDGSSTLLMTSSVDLNLTIDINEDSFSRIENDYDPVTVRVKFYNGGGWSETYTIDFLLVDHEPV